MTHEVQGLLLSHGMAAAAQSEGSLVDWQRIKRAVIRSKPPFADGIDLLIALLSTRAGGAHGDVHEVIGGRPPSFRDI